jgi:hypothetical protein
MESQCELSGQDGDYLDESFSPGDEVRAQANTGNHVGQIELILDIAEKSLVLYRTVTFGVSFAMESQTIVLRTAD